MDIKAFLQIQIYTRKFFRTLKKESFISIVMGIIITLLVMMVTKDKMFEDFEGTKSGMFSLICVCIWIGIFNSIQLVCREKNDIVKDELDKSLHASAYMASHFIYQFLLCLVQSIIVFVIFYIYMSGKDGFGDAFKYFITIFLMMFASDAMAFVISCAVPNPIVAMTVMPLMLLVQLVMAGVLFELKGTADFVANFTISKWGMSALGTIGKITQIKSRMQGKIETPPGMDPIEPEGGWIPQNDLDAYGGDMGDVTMCWLYFMLFIAIFYVLSVIALKMTTRRIKK